MIKYLMGALLALFAAAAMASVDVNKADQATLETVKGIGPGLSTKLLDERKKGSFKDWPDLIDRVGGIGPGNAARFSAAGMTVNGSSYAAPAPEKSKGDTKPAAATKPVSRDAVATK
jgi:competence protein ComEA